MIKAGIKKEEQQKKERKIVKSIITNTVVLSKSRSFLWNLIMTVLTLGLWLIWMIVRKRKEKKVTETWATCQSCGKRWKIK